MISIAVFGVGGRMGAALLKAISNYKNLKLVAAVEQPGHPLTGLDSGSAAGCPPNGIKITDDSAAAVEAADVVIDFTFHSVVPEIAGLVAKYKKAYILGTTGLTAEELAAVDDAAKVVPVMMAPNMSVGVNLLLDLVKQAAAVLTAGAGYDAEIVEMHHRHKRDAPSGTALALAKAVAAGRGIEFEDVALFGREGITGEREADTIAVHAVRGGDVVGDHTVVFAADGERIELVHKASGRGCFANGALRAAEWIVSKEPGYHQMRDVLGL